MHFIKYNKFLLSEQIAIWFITFTTFITFKPEMYQINPILHGQSPSFRFPVNKVFLSAAADGAIEAPAKLSRDWSRTALPHECPHCGQGFTRRSRLREHVFQHTGEKLFNCKICKKSFPSPSNLLRHNLTHGGSRIFNCPLCDKRFFQPTSLKRHMLIHQGGESQERKIRGRGKGKGQSSDGGLHICPECPASFKFEPQLKSHRSVCVSSNNLS